MTVFFMMSILMFQYRHFLISFYKIHNLIYLTIHNKIMYLSGRIQKLDEMTLGLVEVERNIRNVVEKDENIAEKHKINN